MSGVRANLRRVGLALATVVVGTVALAGCGGSSAAGKSAAGNGRPAYQVEQTVAAFQRAMTAKDGATACGLLTSGMRQRMASLGQRLKLGDSCAAYVDAHGSKTSASGGNATLVGIGARVNRNATATATFDWKVMRPGMSKPVEVKPTARLVNSHGKWLIAATGPSRGGTVPVTAQLFKGGDTLASVIAQQFAAGASRTP